MPGLSLAGPRRYSCSAHFSTVNSPSSRIISRTISGDMQLNNQSENAHKALGDVTAGGCQPNQK